MIDTTNILLKSIQKIVREIISCIIYDGDDFCAYLPNGMPMGCCTNSANFIVDKLGGNVMGYYHEDNPTSTIGRIEGGHDFTILGNYLVDLWYKEYWEEGKYIYDLTNPDDVFLVAILYGDPSTWEEVV